MIDYHEELQRRVFNHLKINLNDHPSLKVNITEIIQEIRKEDNERILELLRI
jgi:hypothetical protein